MYDLFADSSAITGEQGVSFNISNKPAEFSIANGQKAECTFTFSTIRLEIEYVASATFLFDTQGINSWVANLSGTYTAGSYTEIETVLRFTSAIPGVKAGQGRWTPALDRLD